MKYSIITVAFAFILSGCTYASFSRATRFGTAGKVDCYSGDRLIYSGKSTGAIDNSKNSDGYYFRDSSTQSLVEVSGNCVIVYED